MLLPIIKINIVILVFTVFEGNRVHTVYTLCVLGTNFIVVNVIYIK